MQDISIKIKLVVFSIVDDSLVLYLTNNVLPVDTLVAKIPLDTQVENLFQKTFGSHLENNYIEQLYTTFDNKKEITIIYYVLLSSEKNAIKHNHQWHHYTSLKKTIPEHKIIVYAAQRLQWKIEYTNVVYSLLPQEFTLSELQVTYEAILGQNLDKRNFRKKILSLQFLQPTRKKKIGAARPAQFYSFKHREPTMIKVFS